MLLLLCSYLSRSCSSELYAFLVSLRGGFFFFTRGLLLPRVSFPYPALNHGSGWQCSVSGAHYPFLSLSCDPYHICFPPYVSPNCVLFVFPVLFFGAQLLMLHLSACPFWCLTMSFPGAHLACIFVLVGLGRAHLWCGNFVALFVNTKLEGNQRRTTVSAGKGGPPTSLGPRHLPSWPSLANLVFVRQRRFHLGVFGVFWGRRG